ncbi:unnamed protein product [Haemonchus placei]|uniref:Uncharacterized protein n=1 Tax=Haemonchus placei TaxID=6290 RepID=A0A0N4X892_HAEPC|nr:unnamed protein product [Haemonchus placei]
MYFAANASTVTIMTTRFCYCLLFVVLFHVTYSTARGRF